MAKERKLTDIEDMFEGPMSEPHDNNLDPTTKYTKLAGHRQGGKGDGQTAQAKDFATPRGGKYP